MKITSPFFFLFFMFGLLFTSVNTAFAELPNKTFLEQELKQAKSNASSQVDNQDKIKNLEDALQLYAQISLQKNQNQLLANRIANAPKDLQLLHLTIQQLKEKTLSSHSLEELSLNELQNQLNRVQNDLQNIQSDLANINSKLVAQRATPEIAQKTLSNNLLRIQEIERILFDEKISTAEKYKLKVEENLIKLQNNYNQTLLSGDSELLALYSAQLEEKKIIQQHLQTKQSLLQTLINEKKLAETQQQAEQLKQAQEIEKSINPIIAKQQGLNLTLSQELITETTKLNALSQDNLRIKSVLNNLQQTQRNINEQISALQGTLVLSRIINKQKNLLPQDKLINGLSKQITDLRVKIFDLTELRDNLYDTSFFIQKLLAKNNDALSEKEEKQLTTLLQERYRLISDEIELLNNQLNLSINIELNQKQVTAISDALQNQLQQQSFWVRSNAPINFTWFLHFFPKLENELHDLRMEINFSQWRDYIVPTSFASLILIILGCIILWQKSLILSRLKFINSCVNTLKKDRQRYTPEAIFLTFVLCLPYTAFFLATLLISTFIFFDNPLPAWIWSLKMAMYWLFFSFMLRILNPHAYSIGFRHFGLTKKSLAHFNQLIKSSMLTSYFWLNVSIFTHLDGGVSNDVIGQLLTITVLLSSLIIIAPKIHQSISLYQKDANINYGVLPCLFKGMSLLAFLAPIGLILLVVLGYYYTALTLMHHLIISYFVFALWAVFKDTIYRALLVFSRHLSYRRLLEKQKKQLEEQKENRTEQDLDDSFLGMQKAEDEVLAVSKIKDQVLRVVDLALSVTLIALFYWVWSDLVTVAYYLESIPLWQQTITTSTGTSLQTITLWNLLMAMVIVLVSYALIRNLPGVLEVVLFSHVKFSQGTPYTIITLSTYFIGALGAVLSFSTLGISWSKLQWLLAALSVGLGFGLQEIFANFVSGIIILFERPVRIGDVITIGNYSGTVSRIRIRSTTLVDFDRKEIIVPNKVFVTERIVNWALSSSITRVKIFIGVAYGSDLDLVKQLLLQIADECPFVLKDPKPSVYFLNFGASTLDHELRVYVNDIGHRNKSIDDINHRINQLFAEHQINIAFNQLDVFIKNTQTDEEIKIDSRSFTHSAQHQTGEIK